MNLFKIFEFKNNDYQKIKSFIDNTIFINVKNENDILEQSRINFKHAKDSVEYIEKKADELLKYLGLGIGFVGILLNYSVGCLNNFSDFIVLIGFICWVFSIILALSIRKPSNYPYPSSFKESLLFMAKYGEESQAFRAWMASQNELAMYGHIIIGNKKATKLNVAYLFLIFALFLFFLSFLLRIILY